MRFKNIIVKDFVEANGKIEFFYDNKKFIVFIEKIKSDNLCLYPKGWKIENKSVMPSVIHYESSSIVDYQADKLKELISLEEEAIKILLLDKTKELFIHLEGTNKKLLLPEDTVSDVHSMKQNEFEHFVANYNKFYEFNKYIFKY